MREEALCRYNPAAVLLLFAGIFIFGMIFIHPLFLACFVTAGIFYLFLLEGRKAGGSLVKMLPFCLLIAVLNPLFGGYGTHSLFRTFGHPYTLEALCFGGAIGTMVFGMLCWCRCFGRVMTGERILYLSGKRFPAVSMIFIMILRLVPWLYRHTREVKNARKGIGFEKEGAVILSAIAGNVLEYGITAADSMKSRGFGSGKRTAFPIYRITAGDVKMMIWTGLLIVLVAVSGISGGAEANYAQEFYISPPGSKYTLLGTAAYACLLFLPVILDIKEKIV